MLITEYTPKRYPFPIGEELDIDASNDGDYITCPVHTDEIIYVMGTNFWQKEGGECSYGLVSLNIKGWCWRCCKTHIIPLCSYGG